jgi:membrane protease subunit HflC
MGSRILGILVVLLALVVLIASSTFVVGEQEMAVRVRLSQIKGADFKPGLQFKIPFMDRVVKFDRRVLTRKFDGEQFLTSESQGLTIDYYIKWRILDAEQFYRATSGGDEGRAESLVGETIQDGIKNAVAGRTLAEIVISDRNELTGEFMKNATERLLKLGIQLVDVRVQRIDLQEEVATSVYESMKRTFEGIARTGDAEGARDVAHRHLVAIVEDDGGPLPRRQAGDRLPQPAAPLILDDRCQHGRPRGRLVGAVDRRSRITPTKARRLLRRRSRILFRTAE